MPGSLSRTSRIPSRISHPAVALALSFLAAIAVGTALLSLPAMTATGMRTPLVTSLFTATSAVCVTGLVVVDTGTYWSPLGQWTILALFQVGGFGMMTSATLLGLLVNRQLRLRSRLMLQAETHALGLGDVSSVARLVLVVTVAVELAVAALLALRFWLRWDMPPAEAAWQGLFHAVSAFNNAGFSTWGDGLMRFATDAAVLLPLMAAIVIGGLGFPVLHELWRRRSTHRPLTVHAALTLWGSVALIVGGAVLLMAIEWNNDKTLGPLSVANKALVAAFTSVSARTAGFNALDIGGLSVEALNLHYLLMFIGGGSGGTAGGVKVTTFFVVLLIVWSEVRGHADVEFKGRRIGSAAQRLALAVLVLSAGAIVIGTLVLVPLTTLPYEKVLFEVISAFATVGLSTGITAELARAGQLVLVVLMYTGRIGVVTLAAAMAVNTAARAYRLPEEKPIVG